MADMVVAEDEDALGSQSLSHRFVVEADVFSVAVANVDSGPDVSLGPPVGASQGLLRLGVAKVEYEGGPFLDEELVVDVDREVDVTVVGLDETDRTLLHGFEVNQPSQLEPDRNQIRK